MGKKLQEYFLNFRMEYFRCSYLVTHKYDSEELNMDPPMEIAYGNLIREVRTNNPMITVQELPWDQLISSENSQRTEFQNTSTDQLQNFDMLQSN